MKKRIGRRGAYLLLTSIIYLGHGWAFITTPSTPALRASLAFPLAIAPLWVWGLLWLVAGVVSAVSAFRRGPHEDRWGFYALIVMAMTWGAAYLTSFLAGQGATFSRGMIAALLYIALAGAIFIVGGWTEPTREEAAHGVGIDG